jgi:hypothetical protein
MACSPWDGIQHPYNDQNLISLMDAGNGRNQSLTGNETVYSLEKIGSTVPQHKWTGWRELPRRKALDVQQENMYWQRQWDVSDTGGLLYGHKQSVQET